MPISATGNSRARPGDRGFTSSRRSADHGFRSPWRSAEHGFTLLELLVVVAIIGVMTSIVVIALPDPRGRLVDEAERFAARAIAARDSAIITARTTRLTAEADGYGFEQRKGGDWIEIADRPFRHTSWTEGTSASAAQVEFDPTGLATPEALLVLRRGDERVSVSISTDGAIRVRR